MAKIELRKRTTVSPHADGLGTSSGWLTAVALGCLVALNAGCPVADPFTRSLIVNDSDQTVELEFTLDTTAWSHGFTPEAFQAWLSELTEDDIRQRLAVYATQSTGVELLKVDSARFAGTYRIDRAGQMIVHESLGAGPYFPFSELRLTRDGKTSVHIGESDIGRLFRRVEGNLWELRVTDAF